jgi:integrase
VHITEFRDSQLARGLHANSVRRHINMLNAMVNMAFKHLDIDRLSPFRRLYIRGEGGMSRTMAPITQEQLCKVKAHLLSHPIPSRLAALIQLNTGMRISEPVLARLDDLVLDHDIPHLWVRKNSLTDRKTQASIRCVPLLGVLLEAAQELHRSAVFTSFVFRYLIAMLAQNVQAFGSLLKQAVIARQSDELLGKAQARRRPQSSA